MYPSRIARTAVVLTAALSLTTSAVAQHDHAAPAGRLGTVHFATSCAPAVQPEFDRGVALLHSFWFSAAVESFNTVLKGDPRCAMAHWGIAMSWWGNPFGGFRSPQALDGRPGGHRRRARPVGAGTDREKAYLAAVDSLFRDAATRDQRTRTVAYEKAMEALAATYPDDIEARIFYALALGQTALPTDKTYANQLKAAGILEAEFARQPEHPGPGALHHPQLRRAAAGAARARCRAALRDDRARRAARAPHAVAHVHARRASGRTRSTTNLASAAAARKDQAPPPRSCTRSTIRSYAYLQTAQDAAAPRTLAAGRAARRRDPERRRRQRRAAVGRLLRAGGDPGALRPRTRRLGRGGRARAAADAVRAGPTPSRTSPARSAPRAAATSRPRARTSSGWRPCATRSRRPRTPTGPSRSRSSGAAPTAWVLLAEGRPTEALTLMREAADREDATEKSAVTPGPIKPARELLGEMLLQLKRPAEALVEFEATLTKEPNRFRAIYGAARAADGSRRSGEGDGLLREPADDRRPRRPAGRPELAEARSATR